MLVAKVQVRCPHCNTQHGIFARKSNIPNAEIRCFDCGNDFNKNNRRSWEVVYEIKGDPDDFFRDRESVLAHYVDTKREFQSSFFQDELDRLKSMDNHQKRGRSLDRFVGLLFQQLPGVNVRLNGSTETGEVDVYIDCLEAEDWLQGIVGSHTMIENKWEKDPIQTSDISKFRSKTTDIHNCQATYFLSMSGFTRGKRTQTGALHQLRQYEDPKMIDLWNDDLEQMLDDGSPENTLRKRMMS